MSKNRVRGSVSLMVLHGLVHGVKIAAAEATRIHATPRTPTAGKSRTAKDGPR
jgi:hypothetical protein